MRFFKERIYSTEVILDKTNSYMTSNNIQEKVERTNREISLLRGRGFARESSQTKSSIIKLAGLFAMQAAELAEQGRHREAVRCHLRRSGCLESAGFLPESIQALQDGLTLISSAEEVMVPALNRRLTRLSQQGAPADDEEFPPSSRH